MLISRWRSLHRQQITSPSFAGQEMSIPLLSGWEGNRRSGVVLATRQRFRGISSYLLNCLKKEMSTPTSLPQFNSHFHTGTQLIPIPITYRLYQRLSGIKGPYSIHTTRVDGPCVRTFSVRSCENHAEKFIGTNKCRPWISQSCENKWRNSNFHSGIPAYYSTGSLQWLTRGYNRPRAVDPLGWVCQKVKVAHTR